MPRLLHPEIHKCTCEYNPELFRLFQDWIHRLQHQTHMPFNEAFLKACRLVTVAAEESKKRKRSAK